MMKTLFHTRKTFNDNGKPNKCKTLDIC